MMSEHQQELAGLYALGTLTPGEQQAFEAELRGNAELHAFTRSLQSTISLVARSTSPTTLPPDLKSKVLQRIDEIGVAKPSPSGFPPPLPGLGFALAASANGWKELPVPGTFIKLLSLEKERGYAVLLGKLEPGARYPAHINMGPEDFYILTGDLVIGDRKLIAGDFHHADAGSQHEENYSIEGCTLIAVLTTDDPLVAFAMA